MYRTGQPCLIRGFRGYGASLEDVYGHWAVETGRAVPILGAGLYLAFTEQDASGYGRVMPMDMYLRNPFVLEEYLTWLTLTHVARTPHLLSTSWETRNDPGGLPEAADRMQRFIRQWGHDGVVVLHTDSHQSLTETFGHDQAVRFA